MQQLRESGLVLRWLVEQPLELGPCLVVKGEQPPVGKDVLGALLKCREGKVSDGLTLGARCLVDPSSERVRKPHVEPIVLRIGRHAWECTPEWRTGIGLSASSLLHRRVAERRGEGPLTVA